MLSAEAIASIDAAIDTARSQRVVEVAVLLVDDIGAQPPRAFATATFNAWGLGDPQRHDGVLVFVARAQRAAEIVLGQGIDDARHVAISQRIMDDVLVPHLRDGDVAGGVQATVEAVLRDLHGILPLAPEREEIDTIDVERDSTRATAVAIEPQTQFSARATAWPRDAVPRRERFPTALLVGSGALGLVGLWLLRAWWRVRGRNCPQCNAPMQRLSEAADDAHLQASQRVEERLRSVDYDVWACTACAFVDTRRYGKLFSGYARCDGCNAIALQRSQTTLVDATYDQGGRVRIDERCHHCGRQHAFERNTPRRSRPRSGGGGGGFSGGGGGGGSSGGRSRGGGASGRW